MTATRPSAQLFRDLRFRQALSYATDRDGIAQSIMKGPFLRAWAGGLYPGAPEFDQESVVYYPYDADIRQDPAGRDRPEGHQQQRRPGLDRGLAWPGRDVVLQLLASEDAKETQSVAEALVNQWGAVGIKINMTASSTAPPDRNGPDRQLGHDRRTAAGRTFALPFTDVTGLAPITKNFTWHREGDKPRQLHGLRGRAGRDRAGSTAPPSMPPGART